MNDFIHGPQLSHPPDGPGGLLSQEKPHNHGMSDPVSGTTARPQCSLLPPGETIGITRQSSWIVQRCSDDNVSCCLYDSGFGWAGFVRHLEEKKELSRTRFMV